MGALVVGCALMLQCPDGSVPAKPQILPVPGPTQEPVQRDAAVEQLLQVRRLVGDPLAGTLFEAGDPKQRQADEQHIRDVLLQLQGRPRDHTGGSAGRGMGQSPPALRHVPAALQHLKAALELLRQAGADDACRALGRLIHQLEQPGRTPPQDQGPSKPPGNPPPT